MKKTVPLKKELTFKSNVAEITSIALDHDLSLEESTIKGNMVVSGSYKMNDVSINTEEFTYNIPVNIELSDHYDVSEMTIDIDDFYYEIIDSNILSVSIELGLDHLKEKEVEQVKEEPVLEREVISDDLIEQMEEKETTNETIEIEQVKETKKEIKVDTEAVKSLFDSFDDSMETYSTYKVCVFKEADTIESIILKYGVDREALEQYNDLSDVKIGDKLIIPAIFNAQN